MRIVGIWDRAGTRTMADVLPPEILARWWKFGNGVALAAWLVQEQSWREVRELLVDPSSRKRGGGGFGPTAHRRWISWRDAGEVR